MKLHSGPSLPLPVSRERTCVVGTHRGVPSSSHRYWCEVSPWGADPVLQLGLSASHPSPTGAVTALAPSPRPPTQVQQGEVQGSRSSLLSSADTTATSIVAFSQTLGCRVPTASRA